MCDRGDWDGTDSGGLPMVVTELQLSHRAERAARGDWWDSAACRTADPDIFFPVSSSGPGHDEADQAKAVCAGCRGRHDGGGTRRTRRPAANAGAGQEGSRQGSLGGVGLEVFPRRGSWPEGERKRRRFRGRAPLDRAVAAAAAAQGAREPAPRAAPPARSTYCPEHLLPGTLSAQTT